MAGRDGKECWGEPRCPIMNCLLRCGRPGASIALRSTHHLETHPVLLLMKNNLTWREAWQGVAGKEGRVWRVMVFWPDSPWWTPPSSVSWATSGYGNWAVQLVMWRGKLRGWPSKQNTFMRRRTVPAVMKAVWRVGSAAKTLIHSFTHSASRGARQIRKTDREEHWDTKIFNGFGYLCSFVA